MGVASDHQAILDAADQEKAQRDQSSNAALDQSNNVAALNQPKFGFERFLEQGLAGAGGQTMSGSDNKSGFVYTDGPHKGKNTAQVTEELRKQYASLPDTERAKYEDQAHLNDVRSDRDKTRATTHDNARAQALGLTDPRATGASLTSPPASPAETPAAGTQNLAGAATPPPKIGNGQSGLDFLRPRNEVLQRTGVFDRGTAAVAAKKKEQGAANALASKPVVQPPGARAEIPATKSDLTMNTYGLSLPDTFS